MKKTIVVNLLLNTVGAFLYTVAINGFLISNHLGEGGVTGLMTIFYYWLKIAPSVWPRTPPVRSGSPWPAPP